MLKRDFACLRRAGLLVMQCPLDEGLIAMAKLGVELDANLSAITSGDVGTRWQTLLNALREIGADQINYGVFDLSEFDRHDAPVSFLTSMRPDWIEYYSAQRLDLSDPHVAMVRAGNLTPYFWGANNVAQLEGAPRQTSEMTKEAGLASLFSVPLLDSHGTGRPIAGITMGCAGDGRDFARAIYPVHQQLQILANMFHQQCVGAVRRQHYKAKSLSARERDCLAYSANGLRAAMIAHKMGISESTIELHFRNARKKLKASNHAQTIARAIMFGEIQL